MNSHDSEIIKIGNKEVEIDKELVPLIMELNKVGLKTRNCCIGGNNFDELGRAYISFDSKNLWVDEGSGFITIRWKMIKE